MTTNTKLTQVHNYEENHISFDNKIDDLSPLNEKQSILKVKIPTKVEMENFLDQNHPRHDDPQTKKKSQYDCSTMCEFKTGWNCCCSSSTYSDSDKYGVGVTLYFRFIKKLCFFFFLFTIISIPQIFLNVKVAQNVNQASGLGSSVTFTEQLMETTTGVYRSLWNGCAQYSYPLIASTGSQQINLTCISGKISTSMTYGLYQKDSNSIQCNYQDPYQLISTCNTGVLENDFLSSGCIGSQSCIFTLKSSHFDSTCSKLELASSSSNLTVFIQTSCNESKIDIQNYSVKSTVISAIQAGLDLGICLLLFYFLFALKYEERKAFVNVKQSSIFISNFSLQFTDLPEFKNSKDLTLKFKSFLEQAIKKKFQKLKGAQIVDVQVSESNRYLSLHKVRGEEMNQRNNLLYGMVAKYNCNILTESDLSLTSTTHKLKQFMQGLPPNAQQEFKGDLNQIEGIEKKILNYDQQIKQERDKTEQIFTSAYVTFETIEQRNYAQFLYGPDLFKKMLYCCCGNCCVDDKTLVLNDKVLEAKPAPDPENIIWENQSVGTFQFYLRNIISVLSTLVLILLTVIAIVILKTKQIEYEKNNPSINCAPYPSVTQAQTLADLNAGDAELGLLECYCRQDFINRITETFADGQKHCYDWFQNKVQLFAWPFLIVFTIIVINEAMKIFLTYLSKFEKHKHLSQQLSSRLLKIFMVQFLNTAIVILIINTDFDKNSKIDAQIQFILNGQFSDIIPLWFLQVGTTIILTMIFYIIFPILVIIFTKLFICIKMCCDTACLSDGKLTRKHTQQDYNNLNLGPEFNIEVKYASVLTVVCVALFYAPGLPVLYLTTLAFLFITYWIDKYVFLCVARKPKKIDKKVANLVRQIMKFFLIVHMIWSIWIYGSEYLFQPSLIVMNIQSYQQYTISTIGKYNSSNLISEFFSRATAQQCIPTFILFLISISIWIVWPLILLPILKTIFFFCCNDNSKFFQRLISKGISMQESILRLMDDSQKKKEIQLINFKLKDEKNQQYREYLDGRANQINGAQQNHQYQIVGLTSYDILMNEDYQKYLPEQFKSL